MTQPKEWPFRIISEYTNDPDDLAKAFINHAKQLENFLTLDDLEYSTGVFYGAVYRLEDALIDNDRDEEDFCYLIDELMEVFSMFAPEDYYFGANPDDGACFGYWKVNDED